jgi:hypothetical protein
VPNADGVPVTRYVVLRNRTEVATVGSTSFQDQARTSGAAQHPTSVEYQVVAVDEAGNRSAPVRVVAQLPGIASGDTLTLVGLGLLVLAGLAGGYGLWRTWSGHRIAARDELSQSHPDPDASLPEAAPGAPRSSEDLSPHR